MNTTITPHRFEDLPALHLAGLLRSYTFDKVPEIGRLWNEFGPQVKEGEVSYGVSLANGREDGFDYLAGVEHAPTGDLPEGWQSVAFPAQRYAVFTHEGTTETITGTIDGIMRDWFPASGMEMTMDPILFERYGLGFDPKTMSGDLEIWVPVKEKQA